MSNGKIEVDRLALWEVVEYCWEDLLADYLATGTVDRPCHVFRRLVTVAEGMAKVGDQDAQALLRATFNADAAERMIEPEIFVL